MEIFTKKEMFDKKILIVDDNNGDLNFDINSLKDNAVDLYEDFMNDTEQFLINLNRELHDVLKIRKLKLFNFNIEGSISKIRKENVNKIIKIRGMVAKTTKVIIRIKSTEWACENCGAIHKRIDDIKPIHCLCSSRATFNKYKEHFEDIQEVELEELQDDLCDRQPQKIRVRLLDDLCSDSFTGVLQPGNKIEILGIVNKVAVNKNNKQDKEQLFEYKINAININPLDEKFNKEEITSEDIQNIIEISRKNPLELLSKNLAPSIYGHDEIKKALILQMVGGVRNKRLDSTYTRDRIHILLCGDPSVGKSQLGRNLHIRMPRSYYISGDELTKAGLVGIVDRDTLLNQWCLKAGAISKANDSVLVIDEMDKMDEEDRKGLHTPMELGEVLFDKADIHTRLPANCSILGIANPKDGIFSDEPNNFIAKQIDLPAPILTRFDLIFVMKDDMNQKADDDIINIICGSEVDLEKDCIPISLFRKYISYARQLKPQGLDQEIIKENLKKFYKEIRAKSINLNSGLKGIPITPRHAQGITRLAQASAKINLREKILEEDIELAIKLFMDSLIKLGMDNENGIFDGGRIGFGKTVSKKEKCRIILQIMKTLKEEGKMTVKDADLKERCREKGIIVFESDELIRELNKEGQIYLYNGGWRLNE